MPGEKINPIGSPTEYTNTQGDAWNPKMRKPGDRPVNERIDDPPGSKGLPPNAITGGIRVKGLKDQLYPKPDMGPSGAPRPWKPKGRTSDHDADD